MKSTGNFKVKDNSAKYRKIIVESLISKYKKDDQAMQVIFIHQNLIFNKRLWCSLCKNKSSWKCQKCSNDNYKVLCKLIRNTSFRFMKFFI
jgi:hypothetical protein